MRFVIISDSKGKKNGINERVLKDILTETRHLVPLPNFIVLCGDSVAGSINEEILLAQLRGLKSLIESYHPRMPILPVMGNHEVNINLESNSLERILGKVYGDLKTSDYLNNYKRTVYCLDLADTRIIILNAFQCDSSHKIDKHQLHWLEEKASVPVKNKFVFVHSPPYPTGAHLNHCLDVYPEDRDAFWRIIDNAGVDIVFCGHEHNYSRRKIDSTFSSDTAKFQRSVYQIIAGGGGEKLRDKYKSKEGVLIKPRAVYHFVVVDIDPDKIKVSAISSHGKKLDEFIIDKTTAIY